MLDKESVNAIAAAIREAMLIGLKPGLRISEAVLLLPFERGKLYELISAGEFPKPRRFSENLTGYARKDIDDWIESRPVVETEYRTAKRRQR